MRFLKIGTTLKTYITYRLSKLYSEASRSASNGLSRGVRCLQGRAISSRDDCCLAVGRSKARSQTERKGAVQWSLLSLAH